MYDARNSIVKRTPWHPKKINYTYELLQLHIATLIDSDMRGIPKMQQRSNRRYTSFIQRIKTKHGRIKKN